MQASDIQQTFLQLAVAIAIGLLIGIERGWRQREVPEGGRIAGVRTFGLLGLLGGSAAIVAQQLGGVFAGIVFLGLAGVLLGAYQRDLKSHQDAGITTLVAALLTFVFGAMAGLGRLTTAAAFAVLTVLLLGFKPTLRRWIQALDEHEMRAALKLLLISVVLLPILPNVGFGPWRALNPYEIWWMVVLIASISFVGYFAIRISGSHKGMLYTGMFAGLASSTAATLAFARAARADPAVAPVLATATLLACGTMFPRMLLVAGLINSSLIQPLLAPTLVMTAIVYGTAFYYYRRNRGSSPSDTATPMKNPLELGAAVWFGLLLALVTLLSRGLQDWLGTTGVMVLAGVSGIADVDAITLSLSRMSTIELSTANAALGIVLAASANSLVKGGMAGVIGNRILGLRVGVPLLVAATAGLAVAFLAD